MKKWRVLRCVILCVFVLCGTGVDILNAGSKADIRYGAQYYPGEFVLKGYPQLWGKYGLTVEHILFSSGGENNQALISGRADVNCGSDSKTVALFNVLGDKVLIIGTIQKGDRYSTVVRVNSKYKTWYDLKGKTVGTRLGTGAEQVLRRYFDKEQVLSGRDFNGVNLKLEDMSAALQGGAIEAFTVWEPTCAIAEAQGIGRILRTYGDISLVPVSLHTTVKYANEHRSEIVKFLAVHLDKAELIKNDPNRAAELAAKAAGEKGYNVSADTFKRVFRRINFSIEINDDIIDAIENTGQFLYSKKKIKKIPTLKYDESFLEEAKRLQQSTNQ
jgi:ABC-type nitrate/sulfonate/bicarbonate transport system substrate-binding protein